MAMSCQSRGSVDFKYGVALIIHTQPTITGHRLQLTSSLTVLLVLSGELFWRKPQIVPVEKKIAKYLDL